MDVLCTRYLPIIYNRVRALIPPGDVEDVVQETFAAAVRSIGRYRGDAGVKTWLNSIARRKIADFYRSRGRCVETVPLGDDDEGSGGRTDDPAGRRTDDPAGRRTDGPAGGRIEERALVRIALRQLPGYYQEILLLRFAEGLRFHEIAGELGISIEAAKSRYRRAVKAAMKMMDA